MSHLDIPADRIKAFSPSGPVAPVACFLIQPLLRRVVQRIAARHSALFARLGPHQQTDYVIDPVELPFALHLRPDPAALVLRAVPRIHLPPAGAIIRGKFLVLFSLLDADTDGDSAFFSRDLVIGGNTEAVVRLRNALDDVDGSIAEDVAMLFGAPGRMILQHLRQRSRMASQRMGAP